MTIQEISELLLSDHEDQMKSRVFINIYPSPEQPWESEFQTWYDSLFTEEDLQAEFLLYKQELTDVENERLRRSDITSRFNSLVDMRLSFHTLHPDKANPAIFLRDLISQSDHDDAEVKIATMESKDIELQNQPEKLQDDYIAARNAEYAARGVTRDAIMEAQWERDMEGRPEKSIELQLIRLQVKELIPKPE